MLSLSAPLTFATLLSACSSEYEFTAVEDVVERPDVPPSELMAPCLPPDESVCPINTTTGDYDADCSSTTALVRTKFQNEIEAYLVPGEGTADEFLGGELPMTVHATYSHFDNRSGEGEESWFTQMLFSYGDHRYGEDWSAGDFPSESDANFPRFSCTVNWSADDHLQTAVAVYPANDEFGGVYGSRDLFWIVQSDDGHYEYIYGRDIDYTSVTSCSLDDVDCLATSAETFLTSSASAMIDEAYTAVGKPADGGSADASLYYPE